MPKLFSVVWSPLAISDLEYIESYLKANWGHSVAYSFINHVEICIDQILYFPEQYPIVNSEHQIRKCVLSKHNSLFYNISGQELRVLRIFDVRQEPNKLKFS